MPDRKRHEQRRQQRRNVQGVYGKGNSLNNSNGHSRSPRVPPAHRNNTPQHNGINGRRIFCSFLFSIKALIAIAAGCLALGLMGAKVVELHRLAPKPLKPIYFPPVESKDAALCYHNNNGPLARLEPPPNSFFFGISPSWVNGDLPADVTKRLGYNSPLYNTFITVTPQDFEADIIEWNVQLCKDLGAFLELSVILDMPVAQLPETFYKSFALKMRQMNSQYGVPILLRFMPEMNGFWMKFGNQPTGQIAAWRRLATEVRLQTNLTALLWSPNIAASYQNVRRGDPRFSEEDYTAMDTNNDGVLNANDDPFAPYYPGDEYVDWIGISDYNYDRGAGGAVVVNKPDTFLNPQSSASLTKQPYNFYDTYVTQKKKPFILSETGAPIERNLPGNRSVIGIQYTEQQELTIKQAWWKAIFNSSVLAAPNTALSRMKAAVWFDITKPEEAYGLDQASLIERDFRISTTGIVRAAFQADVASFANVLTFPGKFEFECNGNFKTA